MGKSQEDYVWALLSFSPHISFTMPTDLDEKLTVSIKCDGALLDGCPFVVQGKPEPRLEW